VTQSKQVTLGARYLYCEEAESLFPMTPARHAAIAALERKRTSGEYREETTECPCGRGEDELIATRDRFNIRMCTVICRNCGLVRTNPRLTEEAWSEYYIHEFRAMEAHSEFSRIADRSAENFEREYAMAHGVFAAVIRARNERARVLGRPARGNGADGLAVADVGCGYGGMVRYFNERGWSAAGSDYDVGAVAFGRSLGLDLISGSAEELDVKAPFDAVLLSHVLEHVTDPRAMLRSVKRLLKPDGLLYIELPSIVSLTVPRYRLDLLRYLRFFHTYSYTLGTLSDLLATEGFDLVEGDEWIHAVFVWSGCERHAKPRREHYRRIMSYLRRREKMRRFYYVIAPTWNMYYRGRVLISRSLEFVRLRDRLVRLVRRRSLAA
jgi:SAM-dependent methyltransferase